MKTLQAYAIVGGLTVASLTGSTVHAQNLGSGDELAPVAMLKWREIGPAVIGGRISDIAVDPSDARVIYIGTATAGVWKSRPGKSSGFVPCTKPRTLRRTRRAGVSVST